MPLQLKNYVLTDQLIKEALEIGHASRDKGKEFGSKLCTSSMSPPWELYPGSRCKGNICNIQVGQSRCQSKDSTDMGDIHGHVNTEADFSPADLLSAAYKNNPVTCVLGEWKMRCATRKNDGGSSEVMKKRYPELVARYFKIIQPFYDEWAKSGACPVMPPEVREPYNEIAAELEPFFEFHDFDFSDMVDAMDPAWIKRQELQEQEV